jgi:beta-galactosidase
VVIGRESLDDTSATWVRQLPKGVRLLVFEQQANELYTRLGFRIAERGSRQLFLRFVHPVTQGLDAVDLSCWRGRATLIPEHLQDIDEVETRDPGWKWCDQWSTRVWRCGNWGSVASVLIEKPAKGDWRALVDGEFDLQYAPLLEKVEGSGRMIFCQLDVTGRSEPEPVADALTVKLVNYLQTAKATETQAVCAMGAGAQALCADLGVQTAAASGIWVVSSGATVPANLKQQVEAGLKVLCLGFTGDEVAAWSPVAAPTVATNAYFTRIEKLPAELNGLSNADWAWHGEMSFASFAVSEENNQAVKVIRHGKGCVIFWQVPPAAIDEVKKPYLRTSKRRAHAMAARVLGNLGAAFEPSAARYLDTPQNVDDPYRYYRW